MASPQNRWRLGFSLVELLVVTSIIAVLLALLLPTLSRTTRAGLQVRCLANHRQMLHGWHNALFNLDHTIPLTLAPPTPGFVTWHEALESGLSALPYRPGSTQPLDRAAGCPEIENAFSSVVYPSPPIGYSINVRWKPGTTIGDNQHKSWDDIVNPSSYPWFTDPWIPPATLVPRPHVGATHVGQGDAWSVGIYHPNDSSVVSFADGHANTVERNNIMLEHNGEPTWFLND